MIKKNERFIIISLKSNLRLKLKYKINNEKFVIKISVVKKWLFWIFINDIEPKKETNKLQFLFNIILENLYKKITVIESINAENILRGILKSYID